MKFNPDRHKNTSLRLQNYDYSSRWLYFITISIKDKLCLFGEIKNDQMIFNDAWKMVEKIWLNIEQNFSNIKLHEYIVMPNHFHGIIEIIEQNKLCDCTICRDTPCGYPDTDKYSYNMQKNYFWIDEQDINKTWINIQEMNKCCPYNKHMLGNIIWSFKSETTHKYIEWVNKNWWTVFNKKLWQKDFYEHVIRDENWYIKISEYILDNPVKWEEDKFYCVEV